MEGDLWAEMGDVSIAGIEVVEGFSGYTVEKNEYLFNKYIG